MKFVKSVLLACACLLSGAQAHAATLFADNFDSGPSSLWGNDLGNWTTSGGVYQATSPSAIPTANSSLPFVLTDFSLELDVINVKDGGVWLRSTHTGTGLDRTGVLLITGGRGGTVGNLYWHIVTGTTPGGIFGEVGAGFTLGVSDPHLRITVVGNTYSVFVNGSSTPATTLTTNLFSSGQVALFDNWAAQSQSFDNVVLSTVPEPSPIAIVAFGLGLVVLRVRQRNG